MHNESLHSHWPEDLFSDWAPQTAYTRPQLEHLCVLLRVCIFVRLVKYEMRYHELSRCTIKSVMRRSPASCCPHCLTRSGYPGIEWRGKTKGRSQTRCAAFRGSVFYASASMAKGKARYCVSCIPALVYVSLSGYSYGVATAYKYETCGYSY